MPTLLHPAHADQEPEPHSPRRPLGEDKPLDQTAIGALRQFFVILDAWDRAEAQKLLPDMQSSVDNPLHQAQGEPNNGAHSRRGK